MDENKSFWTTIPGILTGISTVIAAISGLYVAMHTVSQVPPPVNRTQSSTPSSLEHSGPSTWPLVAEETFTKGSSGWSSGNFPYEGIPRFELRMVDGRYRWDVAFSRQCRTSRIYAPYGAFVNFAASIDVKIIDNSDIISTTLHIGDSGDKIYSFNVSSNGQFSLTMMDPSSTGLETELVGWTHISFNSGNKFEPNTWNRMKIVVEDQVIKLYVNSQQQGEYRDITFRGGKIGLSINMYHKGSAVIDFDNLEIRRKL